MSVEIEMTGFNLTNNAPYEVDTEVERPKPISEIEMTSKVAKIGKAIGTSNFSISPETAIQDGLEYQDSELKGLRYRPSSIAISRTNAHPALKDLVSSLKDDSTSLSSDETITYRPQSSNSNDQRSSSSGLEECSPLSEAPESFSGEFSPPPAHWIAEYVTTPEKEHKETDLFQWVDRLEKKEELFALMDWIVKNPFLNCGTIFNKALQKLDPSAGVYLSHIEAKLMFDELTKENRKEGVSSLCIDEPDLADAINSFYNDKEARYQHIFVSFEGMHTFPVYLGKDEDGKVLMVVTDSLGFEPESALLLPGHVDPKIFKSIYLYAPRRQHSLKGCAVFSLRDAIKTFHRQNQEGCTNLFDWIRKYGKVLDYAKSNALQKAISPAHQLQQGLYPACEFSILPPEFLKTAQSRTFLQEKRTCMETLPTFHTRGKDGVRREEKDDYEALQKAFQKHTVGTQNLHVEQLTRKYRVAIYRSHLNGT